MKAQAFQKGLKLNGTCQLSVHTDYDNLLGKNLYNIKKNVQGLLVGSKEVCLEVNVEKTEYMCLCLMNRMQEKITTYNMVNTLAEHLIPGLIFFPGKL
jgi:hypothetical protein